MLAQAYGLGLMFCVLKISNILKSSGRGLEKSELPWEQNFSSRRSIFFFFFGILFVFSFYRYSAWTYIWIRINITKITKYFNYKTTEKKKLYTALHYKV